MRHAFVALGLTSVLTLFVGCFSTGLQPLDDVLGLQSSSAGKTRSGDATSAISTSGGATPEAPVAQTSNAYAQRPYTSWEQATPGDIGEDLHGSPLPDGSGLVFASNRHGPEFKLYLQERTSKRIRRLTDGPGNDGFPAVSSDGKRVAFASNRSSRWQLYVLRHFEDREPQRIGDIGADARSPSWSPNGRELAYCRKSSVNGAWEIWIVDLQTGTQSYVTKGLMPAFSPDGKTLAFQRSRNRDEEWFSIWTVRTTGTHEHEIVSGPDWGAANPAWSPNGEWIAFNGIERKETGTVGDLFCVHPDGTGLRQLTSAPGREWNPTWSKSGEISFTAETTGETGTTPKTAIWFIDAPELSKDRFASIGFGQP